MLYIKATFTCRLPKSSSSHRYHSYMWYKWPVYDHMEKKRHACTCPHLCSESSPLCEQPLPYTASLFCCLPTQCWHDNRPCESDACSQEPSGRTEIKQCISVQEDFQYGFRVDVFFQADCVGAAAMWRVTFVVCSSNGLPTAKHVQALRWTTDL